MDKSLSNSADLLKLILGVLLLLGAMLLSSPATAQQPSSGAVETFEPEFDVGVESRPRVGLYGITKLMMAALEADIPRAEQLLDAGADINERDDSQSTPLMWAVHSGNSEIVRFFIARGADVRAKAYRNATALMVAMTGRHEASAVALIEAGADANGRGNSARNFLEDAAESGMANVVDVLIRNGTDLDAYGGSALYLAVSRGHKETANRLLSAGVDVNVSTPRSNATLLHMAAASGDSDLVQLLIMRGADANQPGDGTSPLYPAATRGYTEVAKLLIENGVSSTVDIALTAIRNGHDDTAVVLTNGLDLEKAEVSEVEQLLEAAGELDNDELNALLLDSKSVRSVIDDAEQVVAAMQKSAAQEHSRLLFARQVDDRCFVSVWDSRSDATTEVARTANCGDELFVSADRRSFFAIDEDSIRIVSIDNSVNDRAVALPKLDYRAWLEHMTPRPDQNPEYMPSDTTMRTRQVGYLEDGSLALVLTVWMPADDEYHYLMRYGDGQWSMIDGQWCHRFGCDNALGTFTSQSTRNWPESRMVWHEAQKLNPFMSSASIEMVDLEYESYQATIHHSEFEIDGVISTLSAFTRPSEHSDTTHIVGISLIVAENAPRELSANQCLTSIVGRYILVYEFFQGRFEVTDLGTGKTVVNDIKTALWLD